MIKVPVTTAQRTLLERVVAEGSLGRTPAEVLTGALLEHAQYILNGGSPYDTVERDYLEVARPGYGELLLDEILEPVTGRALPVRAGEVLRIEQVDGGQCVDFNAYNLHDYKEYLDCGLNRLRGFSTGEGTIVWSSSPRARPMYGILGMADTCDQFYAGHRCTGLMYEMEYGLLGHPNCQATFAEAIREYGLTPDDVHDSYNFWMTTSIEAGGRRIFPWNRGQAGDVVDLIAFFDTLAVPVVCGGDLSAVNTYFPKPMRVQVYAGSAESTALVQTVIEALGQFEEQLEPSSFALREVRRERALERDPTYQPKYLPAPEQTWVEVELSPTEQGVCQGLMARGIYGADVATCLVVSFCRWYDLNRVVRRQTSLRFVA